MRAAVVVMSVVLAMSARAGTDQAADAGAATRKPLVGRENGPLPYAEPDERMSPLDTKNGFRDRKLGMPIEAFKAEAAKAGDPVRCRAADALVVCFRDSDSGTKVGEATLEDVGYSFYEGRLAFIALKTADLGASRALLRALQAAFGPGDKGNPYIESYVWHGLRVVLRYKQDPVTDEARAVFYSIPIMDKQLADQRAKAAAADL